MKQRYLEVGRKMKEYEDVKYEHWKETTEQSLPNLMKKSLLTKVRPSTLPTEQGRLPSSRGWKGSRGTSSSYTDPLSTFIPRLLKRFIYFMYMSTL